jgi:phosphotransferase system HPr (HPr) family protein
MRSMVKVRFKHGLHTRPAAHFTEIAQRFASEVKVEYKDFVAEGKSIIDLLKLNAAEGSILFIYIEGNDAREAMSALLEFMASDQF